MSLFSKLSKNNEKNLYPWSQKKLNGSNSALPRAGHAAACISSDAMVIFGGIHKSNTKKELFYIDTNTLAATSINASGDAPNSRISPTMVTINGHIMLYGGRPISPEEGYDNGFYILNLQHRQWTRVYLEGVQPVERWGHTAVVQDGIMYMFGGQKDGNYFNDLFVFNSSTFKSTPRWDMINYNNECPEPRSGHISAIYESKIYIFGGTNGHYLFNDLWSFDLHTGLWLRIDTEGFIPSPRESCAASIVDDIIYVIGGKGENGSELNDLCAYKIKSRRWFRFQNMGPSPSPRHGLTITTVRDKLYVLGGDNESSKMDDASTIYILDSTKIKYPADAPPPVDNNTAYQQQQQSQQYYESSPSEDPQYQQHYNQQQHQYQQQQVGGQVPSHQHQPAYSLQQQQQQQYQGQYSPQLQNFQVPYPQQNQHSPQQQQQQRQQRQNTPTSPVQQQHHNIVSSDVETQHSPTNNSPISASPRHRSCYPDQNANQPPVRPPRHVSTVPEAALRRPRATSPLPNSETENTHDVRRQLHNGNNTHLNVDSERSSPSIMSITDDVKQQPSPVSPPPRPPREGIGLGNSQRNTVMVSSDRQQVEENLRPKSQMPIRNQSVPNSQEPRQVVGTTPSSINKQQKNEQSDQQQAELQQMKAQQQAELQQMKTQQKHTHESAAAATAAAVTAATAALEAAADEERQSMLREIESRDAIINEMKKKESWWRTEVSLARKQRNANGEHYDEGPDADESLLMDVDHLDEDKVKLFEQLVSVKAELRRVRASIFQQAQPMSDKVSQADRMRTAALQEAAYFKSKYLALKSRRQDELSKLDASRSEELEKRLAAALSENESSNKLLVQLQKQSQHDQMARQATEERAHEAQTRAEEAQQAHQRALEELQVVYTRATKAEIQVRDNAVKIADLTHQLSQALAVQPTVKSQEVTDAQLKASQLEAANLKARNETANLKQKLAEQLDDIARLRNLLQEREDQLTEAKIHLEDYEIQLGMLRESINQQQHATNGYASTKAY